MRFAHIQDGDRPVLHVASGGVWIDVAQATGDERLGVLSGVLDGGPDALERVRAEVTEGPAPVADPRRLAAVLDRPERIFCIGRNYAEHRDEFRNAPTPWPETFLRLPTTVTGPYDDIPRSSLTERLDYEGEMGVIIGRGGRHIAAGDALGHIFGYTIANDLSVRDWQQRGKQWTAGKNFDGTLPVGPCAVTADELDGTDLALTTRVNGEVMQSARTSQFIFDLGAQIEFLSSWTELRPGDLICTGTPGGVGLARDPQVLLVDGDVVEVEVEGIGTIRNRIADDGLEPATGRWRDVATGT
jgi:2-keto-4-pentenoate hydratase/2-oxohepta-3-ene-1,7-dioic acid hydratase in catechol pathway